MVMPPVAFFYIMRIAFRNEGKLRMIPRVSGAVWGCAIVLAALCSGCATIVKGSSQPVIVKTNPTGASCDLSRQGKTIAVVDATPGTVTVEKSKTDISIRCKKQGHVETNANLPSTFQAWSLGNILLGGLVGIAVDAGSGAINEYQTEILVTLMPERFDSEAGQQAFFDIWQARVRENAERTRKEIRSSCQKDQCEALLMEVEAKTISALAEVETARQRAKTTFALKPLLQGPATTAALGTGAQKASWLKVGERWKYRLSTRGRVLSHVTVEIQDANGDNVKERITVDEFKSYLAQRDMDAAFNPIRFQPAVTLPGGYRLAELAPYLPTGTELKLGQSWQDLTGEVDLSGHGRGTFTSVA